MQIVRKEEKEARLVGFIGAQLAALVPDAGDARFLNVVARGFDSPVLRALAVHGAAIEAAGLVVRAIVVLDECGPEEGVAALLAKSDWRIGTDCRILDAHEQLVIGDHIAWIGDCMRREPAKRDAFECYSATCRDTARQAHRAFANLWGFARATRGRALLASSTTRDHEAIDIAIAALGEADGAVLVSTRH
jgi:hypothetical protein